jgi:hypothetical protein
VTVAELDHSGYNSGKDWVAGERPWRLGVEGIINHSIDDVDPAKKRKKVSENDGKEGKKHGPVAVHSEECVNGPNDEDEGSRDAVETVVC